MRQLLRLLCALPVLAAPASSDVLIPGYKPVSHKLVLEASELWQGVRIVATPVRGFGGIHLVEPGAPFTFSSKYGTRLYAAPGGESIPEDVDEAWKASHLSAEIPVQEIGSVPIAWTLESTVTTLRIRRLDVERFELEVVSEDEEHDGRVVAVMAAVFLAGSAGLILLVRRRKRAALAA